MEKKPFFSVIVTEHNSADFMRKGLDSIREQTFTDYELIIVCDNCSDNSAEIAREYSDRVIECSHGRAGLARNEGLDAAEGEWVLWMDDDDWWLHQFVLDQLSKEVSDSIDVLAFSFIFQHWGYAKPTGNRGHHWIAVWNKCWRRSFIADTRFGTEHLSDVNWNQRMMAKNPRLRDWDMPLYYYNYLRPGSQSWIMKEEKK